MTSNNQKPLSEAQFQTLLDAQYLADDISNDAREAWDGMKNFLQSPARMKNVLKTAKRVRKELPGPALTGEDLEILTEALTILKRIRKEAVRAFDVLSREIDNAENVHEEGV